MLPVAILAGGLATRLRPLTDAVPKSLLPVAGRPFIFHQLELLEKQGVDQVVLCVGHLSGQIEAAVGDGRAFGVAVRYSYDGSPPLGTGGALRHALPLLGERFFVLNGDSYLRCSYDRLQSFHAACGRAALMAVFRNENRWDRSNVVFQDGQVKVYEKGRDRADMTYIEKPMGGAVFSTGSITYCGALPANKFDNDVSRLTFNVINRFGELNLTWPL